MRRYYGAGALVLLAALLVTALVVVSRDGDDHTGDGADTDVTTTSTSFPYDFVEAPEEVDVDALAGAKFASLTLATADGLESYLLTAESTGFGALTTALREADAGERTPTLGETTPGASTGPSGPTDSESSTPDATTSTLTYVMDDRTTYTLVLDPEHDVIYRDTQEWRVKSDLADLIESVAAGTAP